MRIEALVAGRRLVGDYADMAQCVARLADASVVLDDMVSATSSKGRRAVARRKAAHLREVLRVLSVDGIGDELPARKASDLVFRELRRDYGVEVQRALTARVADEAEAVDIAEQLLGSDLW